MAADTRGLKQGGTSHHGTSFPAHDAQSNSEVHRRGKRRQPTGAHPDVSVFLVAVERDVVTLQRAARSQPAEAGANNSKLL